MAIEFSELEPWQRRLCREAEYLDFTPPEAWLGYSETERAGLRGRWVRSQRKEAISRKEDPEEYLEKKEKEIQIKLDKEFPGVSLIPPKGQEKNAPKKWQSSEQWQSGQSSGQSSGQHREPARLDSVDALEVGVVAEKAVFDVSDFGMKPVFGETPPTPKSLFDGERDEFVQKLGGEFQKSEKLMEDWAGDKAPRNLLDIYARWPVGKDSEFFIRIERLGPRTWQGQNCSGFVGVLFVDLSEEEFANYYGGRDYQLIVYGPDPRGKRDPQGNLIIKALSPPIRFSCPINYPNLNAASTVKSREDMQNMSMGMSMGMGGATTPADAQIHKTNADLMQNVLKLQTEQAERAKREASQMSGDVLKLMADQNRTQVDLLRDQLERERREVDQIKQGLQSVTKSSSTDTLELLRALRPQQEDVVQRVETHYKAQIEMLRTTHEETTRNLRDRHESELRRLDERIAEESRRAQERIQDTESHWKRTNEEMRVNFESRERTLRDQLLERERALKDELRELRSELKDDSEKRVAEVKERYEGQLRDLDRAHERELRTVKESYDTRMHTQTETAKMELKQLEIRLAEIREKLAEAEAEAAENKDPLAVIQRAEAQAEALGFTKKDESAPQGAWDRLASTVGAGLGTALSTLPEWGPHVLEKIRPATPPGMPPQGAQAPQLMSPDQAQAQVQAAQAAQLRAAQSAQEAQARVLAGERRRRSQSVQWATENLNHPGTPVVASPNLGMSANVEQAPQPAPAPEQAQAPGQAPEQASGQSEQQAAKEREEALNALPELPEGLSKVFSKEMVLGFLGQVDRAINLNIDAHLFAEQFKNGYAEAAAATAENVTPAMLTDYVKKLPGSEESAILRRDGQKWLVKMFKVLASKPTAA
jgi:hypothetical protein